MIEADFWKKYFEVYDILNELRPYQDLLSLIIERAKVHSGDLILDAGAGTGNLAILLEKNGAKVVAFDSSEAGLAQYQQKNPKATTKIGNILEPLPFADGYFDKICSNNVLYTLPRGSRGKVAKELYRVLKPGGLIVVSNIIEGFSPVKIYRDELVLDFKNSAVMAFSKIVRFLVPTIKIFYYNFLIKKENKSGGYDFFKKGEQSDLLLSAGFIDISNDLSVYANQGVLTSGHKNENL